MLVLFSVSDACESGDSHGLLPSACALTVYRLRAITDFLFSLEACEILGFDIALSSDFSDFNTSLLLGANCAFQFQVN